MATTAKKNAQNGRRAEASYRTAQHSPSTEASQSTLRDALVETDEILSLAARLPQPAKVWMSCSTLNANLRDVLTRRAGARPFGEAVRDVIEAGGNVKILLWNDLEMDGNFSPSLARLLYDQGTHRLPKNAGCLVVRATGNLPQLTQNIMHFIVSTDRDDKQWYLRAERAHSPSAIKEADLATVLPAATARNDSDAREFGRELVEGFNEVFEAAGRRAKRQEPDGMYFIPAPVR